MSYILDAIRKSEAERHQESLPENLARQQALLFKSQRKSLVWPLVISMMLLINSLILGYFLWQYLDNSEAANNLPVVTPGESPSTPSVPASEQQAPIAGTSENADSTKENAEEPETTPEVPSNLMAARTSVAQHRSQLQNQHSAGVADSSLAETAAQESAPQPHATRPNAARPNAARPNAARPTSPEIIHPSDPAVAGILPFPEQVEPTVDNSAETEDLAVAMTTESAGQYPHIESLDKAFLRTLPRLVFNSHIFSDDPSGRRIMINSNYMREGQSFSGIRVFEITEQGVVLEKAARRFWVPVVRDWSPERSSE